MKERFQNPYDSENKLCEAFVEIARAKGWRVYPETSGWDILLVATSDVKTENARHGDQIGIQAKLRANTEVLAQAIPPIYDSYESHGPHYRAVLVPMMYGDFQAVAQRLRVWPFAMYKSVRHWVGDKQLNYGLDENVLAWLPPEGDNRDIRIDSQKTCWTPEVEVWTPPGVNSPRSISKWKISAVKLCLKMRETGFVTSADFKALGLHMSAWHARDWIMASGKHEGRLTKYVVNPNPRMPLPDVQYAEITMALRAA